MSQNWFFSNFLSWSNENKSSNKNKLVTGLFWVLLASAIVISE